MTLIIQSPLCPKSYYYEYTVHSSKFLIASILLTRKPWLRDAKELLQQNVPKLTGEHNLLSNPGQFFQVHRLIPVLERGLHDKCGERINLWSESVMGFSSERGNELQSKWVADSRRKEDAKTK